MAIWLHREVNNTTSILPNKSDLAQSLDNAMDKFYNMREPTILLHAQGTQVNESKASQDNCPLLCDKCKLVPPGVRVQLVSATLLTSELYAGIQFAQLPPEVIESRIGRITLMLKVIASTDPAIKVGSAIVITVTDPGCGAGGIATRISYCAGPSNTCGCLQE